MTEPKTSDVEFLDEAVAAELLDDQGSVTEVLDFITAAAARNAGSDEPEPLAAGTFVMYPMPDGGVMFVTSVDNGPLRGIKHTRIRPGMLRAVGVLTSGGSKMKALKALMGGNSGR